MDDHYFDYCEAEAREEAAAREEWMGTVHYASGTPPLSLRFRNDPWMRECPRTSEEIEGNYGTDYLLGGVCSCEEVAYFHSFIRAAGYVPSDDSDNPTWTWSE